MIVTYKMSFKKHPSKSSVRKKIEWLLEHKKLWVGESAKDIHKPVFELMRESGLYSTTTYWADTAIPELIDVALKIQVEAAAGASIVDGIKKYYAAQGWHI